MVYPHPVLDTLRYFLFPPLCSNLPLHRRVSSHQYLYPLTPSLESSLTFYSLCWFPHLQGCEDDPLCNPVAASNVTVLCNCVCLGGLHVMQHHGFWPLCFLSPSTRIHLPHLIPAKPVIGGANGQQPLERFTFVMRTVLNEDLFFNLMRPLIYREVLLHLRSLETKQGQ